MAWTIIQGDARQIPLQDESVQVVCTSPPFWGLRDYGLPPSVWGGEEHEHMWGDLQPNPMKPYGNQVPQTKWKNVDVVAQGQNNPSGQFCPCGAWLGVLGLEPDPNLYIEHMVEIFREVRRVLRKDGTVWLNLGDSYASQGGPQVKDSIGPNNAQDGAWNGKSRTRIPGLKPKDLCGIPWRVALALQADGWWLRSDIIWSKPNPMPESVTDRPTRSHEYVFLLTKAANYYYDADAVREPHVEPWRGVNHHESGNPHSGRLDGGEQAAFTVSRREYNPAGRNLRSVWNIATQPFPLAHFATFAEALVEPCIKAGTSEKGACAECGSPWERVTEHEYRKHRPSAGNDPRSRSEDKQAEGSLSGKHGWKGNNLLKDVTTLGWQPTGDANCAAECSADVKPCLVLDPFAGSGTVGVVCLKLNRSFVGIELKPDYCEMANKRVFNSGSLLA